MGCDAESSDPHQVGAAHGSLFAKGPAVKQGKLHVTSNPMGAVELFMEPVAE